MDYNISVDLFFYLYKKYSLSRWNKTKTVLEINTQWNITTIYT